MVHGSCASSSGRSSWMVAERYSAHHRKKEGKDWASEVIGV